MIHATSSAKAPQQGQRTQRPSYPTSPTGRSSEESLDAVLVQTRRDNPWIKYTQLIGKSMGSDAHPYSYKLTGILCGGDDDRIIFMAQKTTNSREGTSSLAPELVALGIKIKGKGVAVVEIPPVQGYQLLEFLGKGSFGTVFKAQAPNKPILAIKLAQGTRNIEVLATEAKESQSLPSHPHLPNCHDYRILDPVAETPVAMAVFDLMPGLPLHSTTRDTPMDPLLSVKLIIDLIDTLKAAGNPHNDLKPSNIILVTETPEGEKLPIQEWFLSPIDWGTREAVARIVAENKLKAPGEREIIGAPQFLAPEFIAPCIEGEGETEGFEVDHSSLDIYALGVTLYEMIMGKGAHRKSTTQLDLIKRKINDRLPAIMTLPRVVGDSGESEINPLLTWGIPPKDTEKIPQTMQALPTHLAYHLQRIIWRATAQREEDAEKFSITNGNGQAEPSDIFLHDRYKNLAEMQADLMLLKDKIEAWERAASPGYVLKAERAACTVFRYSAVFHKEAAPCLKELGFDHEDQIIAWRKAAGFKDSEEMMAWLQREGLDSLEGARDWKKTTGFTGTGKKTGGKKKFIKAAAGSSLNGKKTPC